MPIIKYCKQGWQNTDRSGFPTWEIPVFPRDGKYSQNQQNWEILGNTLKYTKICYCFFLNVLKVSKLYYVTVYFKNWYIKCIT